MKILTIELNDIQQGITPQKQMVEKVIVVIIDNLHMHIRECASQCEDLFVRGLQLIGMHLKKDLKNEVTVRRVVAQKTTEVIDQRPDG